MEQSQFLSFIYFYNLTFSTTFIMQSITFHYFFQKQKQYFRVKNREMKEERGTIYFKSAVNLMYMLSYVNDMYISSKPGYLNFCMYFCLPNLLVAPFSRYFVSFCEVSESIVCVPVSTCLHSCYCPSLHPFIEGWGLLF